jgi:23S rRNA (uracil1939-C5)-methyltransferase
MIKFLQNRLVEIEIDKLTANGHGVGILRDEQGSEHSVEVPYTVPGDSVQIELSPHPHKPWTGKLVEVLRKSPNRVDIRCRHFGTCGGCSLQQMACSAQLKFKENYVRDYFASFIAQGTQLHPIVGTAENWYYRNKMEYTFSNDAAGKQFLGLIMQGNKHRVLNLTECHLVMPWFTDALVAVREWWEKTPLAAYNSRKDTGTLRLLTLREGRSSGDRMVMLTVSGNPDYAPPRIFLNTLVDTLKAVIEPTQGDAKLSIFLRIQQASPGMTTNFYEMLLYGPDYIRQQVTVTAGSFDADSSNSAISSAQLRFSPTAFFQPHSGQASVLYSLALKMAELKETDTVYDLFCGVGTVGICASRFVKDVVGIDISPESALDARTNAKLNGADNVTIYAACAE